MLLPPLVHAVDVDVRQQLAGHAVPDPILAFLQLPVLVPQELAVHVLERIAVPVAAALQLPAQRGPRHADVDGQIDRAPLRLALEVPELGDQLPDRHVIHADGLRVDEDPDRRERGGRRLAARDLGPEGGQIPGKPLGYGPGRVQRELILERLVQIAVSMRGKNREVKKKKKGKKRETDRTSRHGPQLGGDRHYVSNGTKLTPKPVTSTVSSWSWTSSAVEPMVLLFGLPRPLRLLSYSADGDHVIGLSVRELDFRR